jgi:hypothetical protein
MCEDDGGGVRWQCGKETFCPVKFSYHTANPPPITLTHRLENHSQTVLLLTFTAGNDILAKWGPPLNGTLN